jgi:hypothetical protein
MPMSPLMASSPKNESLDHDCVESIGALFFCVLLRGDAHFVPQPPPPLSFFLSFFLFLFPALLVGKLVPSTFFFVEAIK